MDVDTPIVIGILMVLMWQTRGQRALSRAIERGIVTQADVVEAVGAAQSSVSTWSTGKGRPDPVQREALRRCFGIPERWWLTPQEQRGLGKLRLRRSLVAHGARMRAKVSPRKVNAGTGESDHRCKRAAGSAARPSGRA